MTENPLSAVVPITSAEDTVAVGLVAAVVELLDLVGFTVVTDVAFTKSMQAQPEVPNIYGNSFFGEYTKAVCILR